jgi:hypothetical protein
MRRFDATLYVRPETIRIRGIDARDEDEAYERALEIAMKRYTALCWELDEMYLKEVEE